MATCSGPPQLILYDDVCMQPHSDLIKALFTHCQQLLIVHGIVSVLFAKVALEEDRQFTVVWKHGETKVAVNTLSPNKHVDPVEGLDAIWSEHTPLTAKSDLTSQTFCFSIALVKEKGHGGRRR